MRRSLVELLELGDESFSVCGEQWMQACVSPNVLVRPRAQQRTLDDFRNVRSRQALLDTEVDGLIEVEFAKLGADFLIVEPLLLTDGVGLELPQKFVCRHEVAEVLPQLVRPRRVERVEDLIARALPLPEDRLKAADGRGLDQSRNLARRKRSARKLASSPRPSQGHVHDGEVGAGALVKVSELGFQVGGRRVQFSRTSSRIQDCSDDRFSISRVCFSTSADRHGLDPLSGASHGGDVSGQPGDRGRRWFDEQFRSPGQGRR